MTCSRKSTKAKHQHNDLLSAALLSNYILITTYILRRRAYLTIFMPLQRFDVHCCWTWFSLFYCCLLKLKLVERDSSRDRSSSHVLWQHYGEHFEGFYFIVSYSRSFILFHIQIFFTSCVKCEHLLRKFEYCVKYFTYKNTKW